MEKILHNIRQRYVVPSSGFKVTRIRATRNELGSGIPDEFLTEIFENDEVEVLENPPWTGKVVFERGAFWLGNELLADVTERVETVVVRNWRGNVKNDGG